MTDEHGFVAIGGHADDLTESLKEKYGAGWDLQTAVKNAVQVLGAPDSRTIEHDHIEAGVLERSNPRRRKFRRLTDSEVAGLLAG